MKSLRYLKMIDKAPPPHGTRACYVRMKCRCEECKEANNGWARERNKRKDEMAMWVRPSGPPIEGFLDRGRGPERAHFCPGVDGKTCVRKKPAWLRGKKKFCATCAERATVWNGLIPVSARVKKHILNLRAAGIGYKSINEACGVARMTVQGIAAGKVTRIRAETAKRILGVTKEAYAGGHIIDGAKGNALITKMKEAGLTMKDIAKRLGYTSNNVSVLGKRPRMTVKTLMNIERAWRKLSEELAAKARAARAETKEREVPDLIPSDWLDDDGIPLPQFRSQVARMRGKKAA